MTHEANQRKRARFRKCAFLLLLPLLGGCVYSLQPWYAEGTGGADPALPGVWREVDGKDTWVFLAAGDSLRLLHHGEGELGEFTAISFQQGGWNFLDLTPAGASLPGGTAGWYLHPLHGLHRWQLRGDTLELGSLDNNLLGDALEARPHPPLEKGENRWTFMGTREEMAAYVGEQLLDETLFSDRTLLVRQK
jgi:hypothetical protein